MQLAAHSKFTFKSSLQKFPYPPPQGKLAIKMEYIRLILFTEPFNVDLISLSVIL